jgi:ankyrin repeat protein
MYAQYAVSSGRIEVIAELLNCGVDVDAITNHTTRSNALLDSSEVKDLDTVRFLLQRGASTDHVNWVGFEAGTLCWLKGDD